MCFFFICKTFKRSIHPSFSPLVSFHGNLQGLTEEQRRLLRLSVGKPAATTETTPLAPVYGISESVWPLSSVGSWILGKNEVWPYEVVYFTWDDYMYIYIWSKCMFTFLIEADYIYIWSKVRFTFLIEKAKLMTWDVTVKWWKKTRCNKGISFMWGLILRPFGRLVALCSQYGCIWLYQCGIPYIFLGFQVHERFYRSPAGPFLPRFPSCRWIPNIPNNAFATLVFGFQKVLLGMRGGFLR